MRCLLFFPLSPSENRAVGRTLVRHCSTKVEPTLQTGFTLLELLVVLALLAIMAGMALVSYQGIEEQGRTDTTKFEMAELRKALLQFRRDSGSRDFPGQGGYDCDDDPTAETNTPNPNFPLSFSASVGSMSDPDFLTWCRSTNNFWMLFIDPFEGTGGYQWNEDTHRGWNGPYLQNKGQPVSASSLGIIPVVKTPYYDNSHDNTYLLIDLSNDASASIVSAGANHTLGSISDCNSDQPDDTVLCLLR